MLNHPQLRLVIVSLFLVGTDGASILLCPSNWRELLETSTATTCKLKHEFEAGEYVYFLVQANKNFACLLPDGALNESTKQMVIKICTEEEMKILRKYEIANVDTGRVFSTNQAECPKKDVDEMIKDAKALICRISKMVDEYKIIEADTGKQCSSQLSSSDVAGRYIPLCKDEPTKATTIAVPGPCDSQPCKQGGTCIENDFFSVLPYICICPPGWDPIHDCSKACPHGRWGEGCANKCGACAPSTKDIQYKVFYDDDRDPCSPAYGCKKCQVGVTDRPHCKKVKCSEAVCRNNGRCADGKCTCVPGYTGTLCETDLGVHFLDECEPTFENTYRFCNENGDCYLAINRQKQYKRVCRCNPGFAGEHCEEQCIEKTETCLHGTCVKKDKCECKPGFYKSNCDTACPPGTWGMACRNLCGACKFFPCKNTDGKCPQKRCRIGYAPPECILLKRHNAIRGKRDLVFPVKMELEPDSEDEYFDILDENKSITKEQAADAVQAYVFEQLEQVFLDDDDDVTSEIDDVTFSPKVEPPDTDPQARSMMLKTRQRSAFDATIVADLTVVLPSDAVENSEEFSAELTENMRKNVKDFKGDGFTIKPDSIQVTSSYLDDTAGSAVSTDALDGATVFVIAAGLFAALTLIAFVVVFLVYLKKNVGILQERQNTVFSSSGRVVRNRQSMVKTVSTKD